MVAAARHEHARVGRRLRTANAEDPSGSLELSEEPLDLVLREAESPSDFEGADELPRTIQQGVVGRAQEPLGIGRWGHGGFG